ncbi:MAG: histidine phosphatase family protein [Candidatus Margulisiibacteriota bacterium]
MVTIILMRHGETVANTAQIYQGQGNSPLSKIGIKQAKTASKSLEHVKIDEIYSSDLSRSFETARIIAKPHKIKVRKISELRERFYGKWEGLKFDVIEKKYRDLYKKWMVSPNKARIPDAESLKKLQKRGVAAINKIAKTKTGKKILIVGHGGINRTILFYFIGLDLNNFWKIKQDNCCINIIEPGSQGHKITLLNGSCIPSSFRHKKKNILA